MSMADMDPSGLLGALTSRADRDPSGLLSEQTLTQQTCWVEGKHGLNRPAE